MKFLRYIILILCFVACKEVNKAPVDKETFTSLLIDLHTMEGYSTYANVLRSSDDNLRSDLAHTVYSRYNINKEVFDSCVVYYSHDIDQYAKIYEKVIDSLNRRNSKIKIIIAENNKRDTMNIWTGKDSLSFSKDSLRIYEHTESFRKKGAYKLSLEIKFGESDQGVNNRIVGCMKTTLDSIIPLDTINVKRDTSWQYYHLESPVITDSIQCFIFKLLDSDNIDSLENRDVQIKNIRFINPVKIKVSDFRDMQLFERSEEQNKIKLKKSIPYGSSSLKRELKRNNKRRGSNFSKVENSSKKSKFSRLESKSIKRKELNERNKELSPILDSTTIKSFERKKRLFNINNLSKKLNLRDTSIHVNRN